MKIAMVGSGCAGLVSGACFADFGHYVVCIDKLTLKIARLREGIMPIYEPGLAGAKEPAKWPSGPGGASNAQA